MKRYLSILCLLTLFTSTNAYAAARFKCPAVPSQEKIAVKKAGWYFTAGEKLAKKEKYLMSLDRYLCSLKMKPHSNTMFNIAQVLKLIENKKPAIQRLKKFRTQNEAHPSVPELNQLIAVMEAEQSGESVSQVKREAPPPESKTNIILSSTNIKSFQNAHYITHSNTYSYSLFLRFRIRFPTGMRT
ncbi:MAG: hypothetical protein JXX29_02790 [Deltaproteobacteria bacterium]|nr:hypothetical protein [Deltaproteobacteria bacterium]MBN2670569.1 hypothetical protein [Deltaproteobacteria bacterium]